MRKITIAAAAVSALALTSFGVKQMAHHKDYGSLCHNRNHEYVNVLTAIDLNAEEDDGYDAYTAWKSRKLIQNISGGYWKGEITYFLTAKAKGHVPSERNLWGKDLAEGADFRTVNTAARRRGPTANRPTSMTDLGFGYFDTDLNRMVWRTEAGWSE